MQEPEQAEHFGISVVEAMSAECVPIAFNAGGPREIIMHGADGFLYASIEELVDMTAHVFDVTAVEQREAMGRAAGRSAAKFSPEVFSRRISGIIRSYSD